jgi:hypothetical protein
MRVGKVASDITAINANLGKGETGVSLTPTVKLPSVSTMMLAVTLPPVVQKTETVIMELSGAGKEDDS